MEPADTHPCPQMLLVETARRGGGQKPPLYEERDQRRKTDRTHTDPGDCPPWQAWPKGREEQKPDNRKCGYPTEKTQHLSLSSHSPHRHRAFSSDGTVEAPAPAQPKPPQRPSPG